MTEINHPYTPILFFGGNNSERQVAVATAQNILGYLAEETTCAFYTKHDSIQLVTRQELLSFENPFANEFIPKTVLKTYSHLDNYLESLDKENDFLILAFHGGFGENGGLQSEIEKFSIPYWGSNAAASALCMDKHKTLEKLTIDFKDNPYTVTPGFAFQLGQALSDTQKLQIQEWSYAFEGFVLKPSTDGSSFGLVIKDYSEIPVEQLLNYLENDLSALGISAQKGQPYLFQPKLVGRELTVSVVQRFINTTKPLGGLSVEMPDVFLPPGEVVFEEGKTFDFDGKYFGAGTKEIVPAPLTEAQSEMAGEIALMAHHYLGCRGFSRTDILMVHKNGEDKFYVLETNTLPGMTKASWLPKQLKAGGINFERFIEEQMLLYFMNSLDEKNVSDQEEVFS